MIPKKIHYIWLGNKKKNNLSLCCINSWRRVLRDYQIIEWNEDNLDLERIMNENLFFKKCIEKKLWAFASDYLRLLILNNEGGIYLDTDVEVLCPFGDLHNEDFFVGFEKAEYIGTGVIGAEKGSIQIKRLLDFYANEIWNVDFYNNPIIFRKVIMEEQELFNKCKILPMEYFAPYDPENEPNEMVGNEKTVCIHWYNASWGMSRKGYVFLQTKHIKNPLIKLYQVLRKNIGYYRKRKILND